MKDTAGKDVHFFDERKLPEKSWNCYFRGAGKRVRARSEGDARSKFARQLGLGFLVYHEIRVSPVADRFAMVQEVMLEQEIGFEPQPPAVPSIYCDFSGHETAVGAGAGSGFLGQKSVWIRVPCPTCGKALVCREVSKIGDNRRVKIPAHKPGKKEKKP